MISIHPSIQAVSTILSVVLLARFCTVEPISKSGISISDVEFVWNIGIQIEVDSNNSGCFFKGSYTKIDEVESFFE